MWFLYAQSSLFPQTGLYWTNLLLLVSTSHPRCTAGPSRDRAILVLGRWGTTISWEILTTLRNSCFMGVSDLAFVTVVHDLTLFFNFSVFVSNLSLNSGKLLSVGTVSFVFVSGTPALLGVVEGSVLDES